MCKSILKGQNVPGTDGTYHGTDGDVSPGQTGRTPRGVPPKFFMFIGFFLSPVASYEKEQSLFIRMGKKARTKDEVGGVAPTRS